MRTNRPRMAVDAATSAFRKLRGSSSSVWLRRCSHRVRCVHDIDTDADTDGHANQHAELRRAIGVQFQFRRLRADHRAPGHYAVFGAWRYGDRSCSSYKSIRTPPTATQSACSSPRTASQRAGLTVPASMMSSILYCPRSVTTDPSPTPVIGNYLNLDGDLCGDLQKNRRNQLLYLSAAYRRTLRGHGQRRNSRCQYPRELGRKHGPTRFLHRDHARAPETPSRQIRRNAPSRA